MTVIYRDGSLRLWPIKHPRDGDKDNDAWASARSIARLGIDKWIKLLWLRRGYVSRDAQRGYAPDRIGARRRRSTISLLLHSATTGVISDESHPIIASCSA